jgi:hypothetical protein
MPGQYYVFIPFASNEDNDELLGGAKTWRTNFAAFSEGLHSSVRRKIPKILSYTPGVPTLAGLDALDPDEYTLYVMGHCNIGRRTISNMAMMFVRERIDISSTELANRLLASGMPRNIKNLKLYACYGGANNGAVGTVLDSFGARLYYALVTRGVERVTLTAYTQPLKATVDPGTGHKKTSSDDLPSRHRRQWPN